jgi:tripartite-type tricarboxylate transporter receptor subunit TctC
MPAKRYFKVLCIASGALVASYAGAAEDDFPSKPIRILTGAPGGSADIVCRAILPAMVARFNQLLIIENRPVTASDIVAKATPDAYTLILDGGSFWIAPLLQQTPYDVPRDFAPVSKAISSIYILVVHPSMPVKSVKDLIALAKAKPETINYGTSGVGAASHLASELLKSMAGINLVHVPYKGSALVLTALLTGQEIQMTFSAGTASVPQISAGKLRALGIASKQPSPLAPGLPTISDSGLPGFETIQLLAFFAPVKTPAARINLLSQEFRRVLTLPEVKERLLAVGLEPEGTTPQEFAATLKSELAKWGKLIKEAGIKGD